MSSESHPYAGLEQPDTNNATWFNPKQKSVDEYWQEDDYWKSSAAFRYQKKSKMWTYLGELNDGIRNGKRTNDPYFTYLDNHDLVENVACQLDLPRHYWLTAKRYYWALHDKIIKGVRKDSTAVAVVAYVIEEFQDERPFDPNVKLDDGQTVAEALADQFNMPVEMIHKRYGQVRSLLSSVDTTTEPDGFDKWNMSRRGLYADGTGDYTDVGRGGVLGGGRGI